jgi:hydrogenase-4 component F
LTPLLLAALIPFLVTGVLVLVRNLKIAGRVVAVAAWVQLVCIIYFVYPLFTGTPVITISEDFYLLKLDAAFIVLTGCVAACALTHGHIFFEREALSAKPPTDSAVRLNYVCAMYFILAMYVVYLCKNLGYLWISVESTTLLSAPLVYFSRTKHALEATWKYLIICSVGISFALLGTLFIFASGQHGAMAGAAGSLRLSDLIAAAPQLDFKLLRFGFIFCLLGYGTKAGMFPLHSWLPDAHSEAPAPSSALLSGSLLNCALFSIWQISYIVTASKHAQLSNETTLWLGTATVVAASLFLIRQYALKRLFAYSSIENVGLMLVAIGLNSGPLFFLQALNHSIAKVSLFLLSGNIAQASGKKNLSQQSGLMASAPGWAVLMAMACFASTGAPPFGTFLSEWLILMRTLDMHYYVNSGLLLVALTLSFIVICMHVGKVILGGPNPNFNYFRPIATSAIPALLIICSLFLGLTSHPLAWSGL